MLNNHYNQKARLNYFATPHGDKFRISLIDLEKKRVGWRNTSSVYCEKGLYSDELEYKLKIQIEDKGMEIFDKIINSTENVTLTRDELEAMKKYLLIQRYRNPLNMASYEPGIERDIFDLNERQLKEGENYRERLYRVMSEILDKPWGELKSSKEPEIVNNVLLSTGCSTLIVHTNEEFVINDLGHVTERNYLDWKRALGKKGMEFLVEKLTEIAGHPPTEEELQQYLATHSHFDNFTVYPISSNYAVIFVDALWTMYFKNVIPDETMFELGHDSPFLFEHFEFCTNKYVNEKKIFSPVHARTEKSKWEMTMKRISRYSDPNDQYIFPIIELNPLWTAYLNMLTINEATHFIGCKTPEKILLSIASYLLGLFGFTNTKHDLTWMEPGMDWSTPLN